MTRLFSRAGALGSLETNRMTIKLVLKTGFGWLTFMINKCQETKTLFSLQDSPGIGVQTGRRVPHSGGGAAQHPH